MEINSYKKKLSDKYKVYEFSDRCELVLKNKEKHTHTVFFFAGWNEFASKYIYQLKVFFDNLDYKFKIIIPYLPTYNSEDTNYEGISKFKTIQSWYRNIYLYENAKDVEVLTHPEITASIRQLVLDEGKKLGSTEKIILIGFSQGGYFLLNSILTYLNIKVCFCISFKAYLMNYSNYNTDKIGNNTKKNHVHIYYSRFDKVVTFKHAIISVKTISREFENYIYHFDSAKKHEVDNSCMEYIKKVLDSYFKSHTIAKF